ncbi:MAG: lamin tail domain-containing protein, partial [Planctomycetes bacterium]|nr:lamin tail domain-containing protein [Planctomycetota bacterium]
MRAGCPIADLNGDCEVNIPDLRLLAEQWLSNSGSLADLSGDDRVNAADFAILGSQWHRAGIPLVINEFMASNNSVTQDPQGQSDDWIEIHNYGTKAINIGGLYLTDDLTNPTKWRIPNGNPAVTTIGAGGYLLIWADNDIADAGLHANFKLDAGGEQIALFDSDGSTLIDSVVFDEQLSDISSGRYPDASDNWQFFGVPSPGSENISVYQGFVDDVKFSHERGFCETPFSVTIASETKGAVIYYTLDGTEPFNTASVGRARMGMTYTGPINISRTTCLRAVAIKPGWKSSEIKTRTYIFLNDVIRQSSSGRELGAGWPAGSVNGQAIDYGMDQEVVNDVRYRDKIKDALLAIPTISLVTALHNLFDSSEGIYVNAGREGRLWERPASVELLNPDGSKGFQINAGLRIRGGFSRSNSNPKHAFRLFFRAEYGQAKLRFPLFGDEGVDEFENVDLRTSQNYSWSFQNSNQNTMVREVFSRDVQGQMGHPYTRSRYYHLYINGQYWGIFQTQERSEASYAESYFGGDKDDYDVVKVDRSVGRAMLATDGNMDAYRRLYDGTGARALGNNAAYYRLQGLNPDGTRNPDYERLLDVDNLIDFMIIEYYTGDRDGPGSRFGNIPNNTFSIYNRENPDGFKWFHHDNEHTLGVNNSERNMVTPFTTAGAQWRYFNPHWLHEQLISNKTDYRMRFADRVYRYFFNDGLLTPSMSQNHIRARAEQIELAIIAESARWGDSKSSSPFTRDGHWQPEIDRILNNYLPSRTEVVLEQFKSVGWYPRVDAPTFSHRTAQVEPGFRLTMSAPDGTIYYTLDGSDPRLTGMSQGIDDSTTLIIESAAKQVLVPSRPVSENWKGGESFNDSGWLACVGIPGGVGFERGSGYEGFITLDIEGQMYINNATCYIRIPFTIEVSPDGFDFMTLKIRYDDGFIAYINGVEVARRNFLGTPTWNSSAQASHSDSEAAVFENIDISAYLDALGPGNNILAVQGLNSSTTSTDLLISAELVAGKSSPPGDDGTSPGVFEYTGPITLSHSTQVKARVLSGSTWSALNEATFAVGPVVDNLRITEIMYNPFNPNTEYVELQNVGAGTINLNLVKFTNGIDFTFPNIELAGNEYVVVVQDR